MTGAAATSARFTRRQWRRRLLALRPVAFVVATLALIALGVYAVYFSSWLAATSVQVSGERALTAEEIVDAAHVDLGAPLARLDLSAVEADVAKLPAVADVSVSRSWPHTVTIEVTERRPLAAVRRDRSWWVMDDEGVVFRRTPHRDHALPVVAVGAGASADALSEAAQVVSALPRDVLDHVRRLTAHSMDSIQLKLTDGRLVRWGSADETERKVAVLNVLLDQVRASVYDVSVPERPTTRR